MAKRWVSLCFGQQVAEMIKVREMSTYIRPVTPAEIGRPLRELIDQLVPGGDPKYVTVEPIDGAPPDECFYIVKATVAENGGEALFGWSLWELPGMFIEAEFHAVWERPDGTLLDISPKKDRSSNVLFLHDPIRTYEGKKVNNIRRLVVNDPILAAYLETFDLEFDLMNRGDRIGQHGEVKLVGREAAEYDEIQRRRAQLHLELLPSYPLITAHTPCPCGSGKKVRWCHRTLSRS